MADETLTLPCSRSIILPIDGGDLVEPAVETASIRNAETYVYPDDFPYKMVVDFSIVVNKARRWTSTTVSATTTSSSSDIPDDGGLIEESTARASFSMPFYTVLFTSAVGGDFYLGRLRRHLEITKVVPPEYCTFVAETLCATASPFIQEMVNSMQKLKSFKCDVCFALGWGHIFMCYCDHLHLRICICLPCCYYMRVSFLQDICGQAVMFSSFLVPFSKDFERLCSAAVL